MDIDILIDFAKRYAKLGSCVQEQLDSLLDGDYDDINYNAVKDIKRQLGDNPRIDEAIKEFDEYLDAEEAKED